MSRLSRLIVLLTLAWAFCGAAFADALSDVQVRQTTDEKKFTIYTLVNTGQKVVQAKVLFEKQCSGVSNNQEPAEHQYVVAPGASVELGRIWPQTTCKRDYRITQAVYPKG